MSVETCEDWRRISKPLSIPPVAPPNDDCEGAGSPRLSTYNDAYANQHQHHTKHQKEARTPLDAADPINVNAASPGSRRPWTPDGAAGARLLFARTHRYL